MRVEQGAEGFKRQEVVLDGSLDRQIVVAADGLRVELR